MANLIHNEQVKLFATLLNTVAAASATVGVLAPFSAVVFNGGNAILSTRNGVYALFWITLCGLLHGVARRVLKGLRE